MDVLVDIALTTPIPAPLAIPPSKLFRAHGISVKFLTLCLSCEMVSFGEKLCDSLPELHPQKSSL
jgi:hypothetical protein